MRKKLLKKLTLLGIAASGGLSTLGASAQTSGIPIFSNSEVSVGLISERSAGAAGVSIANTLGSGACRLRLAGDISSDQRHALLAAGCQITDNGYVIVGASRAEDDFAMFDTKLTGQSAFVRFDLTHVSSDVRKVFIEIVGKQANSKILSSSDKPYVDVRIENLPTVIRTVTENGVVRTTTYFEGGKSFSLGIGADLNVGANGILTLKVSQISTDINGQTNKQTVGQLGYAHYLSNINAKLGSRFGTDGRIYLDFEKGISDGWSIAGSLYKDTKSATKHQGVALLLNYSFDGETPKFGLVPEQIKVQLNETIRQYSTTSPEAIRAVMGLGTMRTTSERLKLSETVTEVAICLPPTTTPPPPPPPPPPSPPPPPPPPPPTPVTVAPDDGVLKLGACAGIVNAANTIGRFACYVTDADGITASPACSFVETATSTPIATSTPTNSAINASTYRWYGNLRAATGKTIADYSMIITGVNKQKMSDGTFISTPFSQTLPLTGLPATDGSAPPKCTIPGGGNIEVVIS